jgi:hypothetical protein
MNSDRRRISVEDQEPRTNPDRRGQPQAGRGKKKRRGQRATPTEAGQARPRTNPDRRGLPQGGQTPRTNPDWRGLPQADREEEAQGPKSNGRRGRANEAEDEPRQEFGKEQGSSRAGDLSGQRRNRESRLGMFCPELGKGSRGHREQETSAGRGGTRVSTGEVSCPEA